MLYFNAYIIFYVLEVIFLSNWINKLERKYHNYAIPELTKIMIITYIIGYILNFVGLSGFISFNPYLIMHGQIWRVITWVLMPPSSLDLFTVIMLFFYYSLGTALERTWGDFRYNVYILSGLIFTIIGSFLVYFVGQATGLASFNGMVLDARTYGYLISASVSTYYINMSIFFAFAASYPDMQIMLYFIIPLKIKWIAYLDAVFIAYRLVVAPWYAKIVILVSLLNFLLFYLSTKNSSEFNFHETKRKSNYRKSVFSGRFNNTYSDSKGVISKHKCAVCGRTELDDPTLEFRFCSKCNGNYEYCQDHLFTHKHVE